MDKLVGEGVLERTGLEWSPDYVFAGTGWGAVLYDYDSTFFDNTYIDDEGYLRCHVCPALMDLRSDLSDEELEKYIRNIGKKFKKCYLELKNRETIKAIDSL